MKNETIKRIQKKAREGLCVWRGEATIRVSKEFASDVGDFGRGIYYTTEKITAACYGIPKQFLLSFWNVCVLDVEEAYRIADEFGTIHLTSEQEIFWQNLPRETRTRTRTKMRLENAEKFTQKMIENGYAGLIVIHPRGELEIVDYRPYQNRSAED